MLQSTTVGNYPKLPSQEGQPNIRRLLHRLDKGDLTREELDHAYRDVTTRVVREQVEAGIDLPTDGQIRWDDILTPFAAELEGFEINGLIRWFDNNVYYRKPVVTGSVRWTKPITVTQQTFAQEVAGREIKAVLPAPYSFVELSENRYYHNRSTLLTDVVAALRRETEALIDAGVKHIQFDDPSLQFTPSAVTEGVEALNAVVEGLKAQFWVCYYFGGINPLLPHLSKLRVSVIAADCVSRKSNFDQLLNYDGEQNVCFGILEARNIMLEREDDLLRRYEQISARFPNAWVSPSCGLEFLPHRDALAKVRLLGGSVKRFSGGGVSA